MWCFSDDLGGQVGLDDLKGEICQPKRFCDSMISLVHICIYIYTHPSKFPISLENPIFKGLLRKNCLHL